MAIPSKEPVWVFESVVDANSNDAAADIATKYLGAKSDNAGPAGRSYGLRTRDSDNQLLPVGKLRDEVKKFISYVTEHKDQRFRVVPSSLRKTDEEHELYAELFRNVPANCQLPGRWLERFERLKSVRVVLLDANLQIVDTDGRKRALDQYFAANAGLWNAEAIEIISFGLAQSVVANDKYAKEKGFQHRIISADKNLYLDDAGLVSEILSVAYANKMLCINDPEGTSTTNQVNAMHLAACADVEIDGVLVR